MRRFGAALLGLVLAVVAFARPAHALSEPELLVERARVTALTLLTDPEYQNLKGLVGRARAVLILPNVIQAGFFLGGGGGTGVMVARGDDGAWSGPAFYTMAEASFGLQFGGQSSEMILVIMTQKGLDAIMDRKFKLGADANVAIGELGTGVGAAYGVGLSADVYVYAKSSGLFGGMAVEGSVITPRQEFNDTFYGQKTSPESILVRRQFFRPEAQALAAALSPRS
ncbi:lipid-binding SYLF domain-containing protein [Aerophototrophica crusticola]|uniref:Lipid-binding SYLF domain-containing protein n=1 Tax=Aerophototrophica crusticola TaxID=1709002 RepID=A0A858R871_9PROT|nr:lipid-binding SYLF domain-containing protein [Rhodospirillaceae bacterium B3]